jgi:hypothetical protein
MSDSVARTGWLLPILLAVTTAAALGLGFLYLTRSNTGELGNIRVHVTDEDGKSGNSIRVYVAEAPLVQKDSIMPVSYTGAVQYPAPYLTKPNLKIASAKRQYSILAETEFGFTWLANMLPEDLREDTAKDSNPLLSVLPESWVIASAKGNLKPKLAFEEFTWEAKGLRMPASALPLKTFEQSGSFGTMFGQDSVVFFPIPYDSPPNVEFTGAFARSVIVTECTAKSFKWKNVSNEKFGSEGSVGWTSKGIRGHGESK